MNNQPISVIGRLGDCTNDDLMAGFERASIRVAAHGRPIALTLWQGMEQGIRFESMMHDFADRSEIGVLSATRVSMPFADEEYLVVSSSKYLFGSIARLLVNFPTFLVESGVIMAGHGGMEIVVVAGVYPYTLAISGLGEASHRFEPEYPMSAYLRQQF